MIYKYILTTVNKAMCNNWSKYSTLKQLLISISVTALCSLVLIEVTASIFLQVVTTASKKEITNALIENSQLNLIKTTNDSANVFDKKLDKSAKNFLNIIAFAAGDTYRSDYPYGKMPFYYQGLNYMAQPLVYDARYNSWVSYSSGDVTVAGYLGSDIHSFSNQINQTLYQTQPLDPLLKILYYENSEFLAGYMGFQQDGIFREYPGATNNNDTQLKIWDTRQDDWYKLAQSMQRTTLYTPVYFDVWVRKTMISIVRSIHHIDTGAYMGTAGSDMLTENLQKSIETVKYLQNGRAVLIEIDTGNVIANSDINNQPISQLYTYMQLNGIKMTQEIWDSVIAQDAGFSAELDNYYLTTQVLKTGNRQYVVALFTSKNDVLSPVDPIISDINKSIDSNAIMIACVFVGTSIIVVAGTYYLAKMLASPLQTIMDGANKLASAYISGTAIKGEIQMNVVNSDISETKELQKRYSEMVNQLRNIQNNAAQPGLNENRFYAKGNTTKAPTPSHKGEIHISIPGGIMPFTEEEGKPSGYLAPIILPTIRMAQPSAPPSNMDSKAN